MGISRGVNKVILIGNVGKDPEVKHLDNGTVIAKFSLATTEVFRTKDNEKNSTTEWHNIVVFKNTAEIVEKYVKKGDALYIEGKIQTRSWDDKEGNKKYMTEIIGNNVQMLGGGGGKNDNSAPAAANTANTSGEGPVISDNDDDLPF